MQGIKGRCLDSKCTNRGTLHCEGNRISIDKVNNEKRAVLHLPHHKSERHIHNPMVSGVIKATLPEELSRLLIRHIEARHIMWGSATGAHEYLFGSAGGRGAGINPKPMDSDDTSGSTALSSLFDGLLNRAPPCIKKLQPKLTPTLLRTSFIEAATERVDQSEWESLALAMGNTPATWVKYYAVGLKNRKIQSGVDRFQQLMKLSGRAPVAVVPSVGASSSSQALVPYHHPMERAYIPSTLVTIDDEAFDDASASGSVSLGDAAFDGAGCWRGWESLGCDF